MKNIIFITALLTVCQSYSQLDRSIRPIPAPAPEINIKSSQNFTLDNGLTVIVSENHKVPKVSISLYLGSDPILEGQKAGLADFAGQLMMSGTKNRDKDQLDKEIDYIGARLSASANSMSLSCLTKHLDKGLQLMTDVLYNPAFPESEFKRLEKQRESNLKSIQSEADGMVANAMQKVIFPTNHPYHEVMTETTLNNINLADLQAYHRQIFVPAGAYLVVVGDITLDKTKELVNQYFGNWKGGKAYKLNNPKTESPKSTQVYFVKKPAAVQSAIRISFPIDIKPGDEDQIKLSVLNNLLGGGVFGNRLMQNLREDKAYTYGCRSFTDIDELGSYFSTTGSFRNEVTDSSVFEILKELRLITEGYVTDEELSSTKNNMAGSFALSLENPATIARFAVNIKKYNLPSDYYQTYLQRLEKVNKEDILLMAQKYITASKANIIVVGNEKIMDNLKKFDSDGKIVVLDAFGDLAKERVASDISAEKLIDNYILAATGSSSMKQAQKKLKKIKSVTRIIDLTSPQIPIPLKLTEVWMAPNVEANKIEGQGMVIQKSYFDGKSGGETSMQAGKSELSAEEIAAKNMKTGYLPEMNYNTTGMKFEMIGLEEVNGEMMYVVKSNDGKSETLAYYAKNTLLKRKEVTTETRGEETITSQIEYSDYKEVNGIQMPYKVDISTGPISFSGIVSSIQVNEKVDLESYK